MNERQEYILSAVVKEYTTTGLPVGSQLIVQKHIKEVSPATVRNDMAFLEDEGYLVQPHISSGRIPSDKGYRYFIESMMEDRELNRRDQVQLQKELLQLKAKNVRMARTTAKLLAALSGNVGLSGVVNKEEFYEFGLRKLLEETSTDEQREELCQLAEALDYIDEKVDLLLDELKEDQTKIYIGKENPISEISGYSMVVSPYKSKEGDRGVVAVIGPKRMQYARNKSLVEYMKKLLSSSELSVALVALGSSSYLIIL